QEHTANQNAERSMRRDRRETALRNVPQPKYHGSRRSKDSRKKGKSKFNGKRQRRDYPSSSSSSFDDERMADRETRASDQVSPWLLLHLSVILVSRTNFASRLSSLLPLPLPRPLPLPHSLRHARLPSPSSSSSSRPRPPPLLLLPSVSRAHHSSPQALRSTFFGVPRLTAHPRGLPLLPLPRR